MPELDAVTMATPRGDVEVTRTWTVPADWPAGPSTVSVEVNLEGDYNESYDPDRYPTPTAPADAWDFWAQSFGYPYRGQPSVIYDVEIDVPPTDRRIGPTEATTATPSRMGVLDASLRTMPSDETITDDPTSAPGSGADRLRRRDDGARVGVVAEQTVCREL